MEKEQFSKEEQELMRAGIDFFESQRLAVKIKELAEKASVLAKKLQGNDLSESEREEIGRELKATVEEGYETSRRQKEIFARSS